MTVTAIGPEFIVNAIPAGDQYRPFITTLATGGFVIGWQDASHEASLSDDVRVALYTGLGLRLNAGDDLLTSTALAAAQFQGTAAPFSNGKYVVAWTDYSGAADGNGFSDGNNGGIRFAIFNAGGSPSSGEFYANTTVPLIQNQPSVTVLANDKFVVSWTGQDINASSTTDIILRVFNADGSPAGAEKTVNTQTVGNQENSTVHALSTGGFAVVWGDRENSAASGFQTKTFIRFYTAGGAAIGPPQLANAANADDPSQAGFTELSDGRILLTWTENVTALPPGDGSGTSVRARIYDPVTASFGLSFRVNSTISNDQNDAQVAALDHGQFVVVWTDNSKTGGDTDFEAVRMQVFDSTGAKVGGEILVNDNETFEQRNPVITVLPDFRFVVAWEDNSQTGSDTLSFSIHSQIYDARNAAIDIDGTAAGDQYIGSVFNDTIAGLGGNDKLYGGFGFDLLIGGIGRDFLYGDGGDDDLRGGAGNDVLTGGTGNDYLDGGPGADKMRGGIGNDTYVVDSVGDVVIENANQGIDTVKTTLNTYALPDNVERLVFIGSGNFTGTGNALNNRLTGGGSDDTLRSDGAGSDQFFGGAGTDAVDYRTSVSAVSLNFATNVFGGAAAGDSYNLIEKFFGSGSAADTMTGGAAAVQFYGSGGNDSLTGGSAADTLSGGSGNDTLTGGGAADIFVYNEIVFLPRSNGFGTDSITDFKDGTDKLQFASGVATSINDMTRTGQGTTTVTLTLGEGTIVLHSTTAINIDSSDLIFA